MADAGSASPPFDGRRWDIALRNQWNVLKAIFYRDADSRHGRRFLLGYFASAVEPLMIVIVLAFLFTQLERSPPYGQSALLFLGTGVFPIYLFIHTSVRVRQALGIGRHRVRFPIEQPLDLVIVHGIQHFLMSIIVASLYFVTLRSFGVVGAIPENPMTALAAFSAIFLFGLGVGIINSVISRVVPIWDLIWPAVTRTILHFSGLYYVAAFFSPTIRNGLWYNPILHGTNWFRHAFYPFYPDFASSEAFLLGSGLVAITFGLLLEAGTRQYLESRE
jgi:capsular polysaccharide transport system permease protein